MIHEGEAAVPGRWIICCKTASADGAIVPAGKAEEVRELIDASPYAVHLALVFCRTGFTARQRES
ncbi:hypothetical protein [Klebsiella pneumoniae]|uniref:hypothetical protein n=1 Tax=Klebsiella pneumoniae TaxID=573 RepID=UPI0022B605EC|nr:hypothetical protein [Klebsiella pneumoniae]